MQAAMIARDSDLMTLLPKLLKRGMCVICREMVYTDGYSKIDKFLNTYTITITKPGRWVCYYHKEAAGINTIHTFVDNFCEVYTLCLRNTNSGRPPEIVEKHSHADKIVVDFTSIYLTPRCLTYCALPDFAIDVLQTTGTDVGRETLSRVAKVYHDKYLSNAAKASLRKYNCDEEEEETNDLMGEDDDM